MMRPARPESCAWSKTLPTSGQWSVPEFSKAVTTFWAVRLSALDGVGPDELRIPRLKDRVVAEEITEVILALNATVDGQTTAHYIADQLEGQVRLTSLAQGVPIGGELDYLDDGTITAALRARKEL